MIRARYIYERTGKTMDNEKVLERTDDACEQCSSKTKERSENAFDQAVDSD